MDIFDKLVRASSTKEELHSFLADNKNSIELSDFFSRQSYRNLQNSKQRIEEYILPRFGIYSQLDFTYPNNIALTSYLLELSERFGFLLEFQQLYNFYIKEKLHVPSRLNAASKYLIGITRIDDYFNRILDVLNLLKIAYLEEEDKQDTVVATFINFYAQVVHNFVSQNKDKVLEFREELVSFISDKDYLFLDTEIFQKSVSIGLEDNVDAYEKIQHILDEFLSRTQEYLRFNVHDLILEGGTRYEGLIQNIDKSFDSLRNLCSELYQQIANDSIFYSLQRGVAVLEDSNQLLAYMNSYGKMHNAKILSALNESNLPAEIFDNEIEIYDWGCGQGLASFVLFEKYPQIQSKVTLIEPSEIALKRAALHIKKISSETKIVTINKDLDSLVIQDFNSQSTNVKIHLFSNILDAELFSMAKLIELLKESFIDINYFICVSPFIDIKRVNRLNNFMGAFREFNGFKEYMSLDNPKGTWNGTNWSRAIRVFKAKI